MFSAKVFPPYLAHPPFTQLSGVVRANPSAPLLPVQPPSFMVPTMLVSLPDRHVLTGNICELLQEVR